MASEQAEFYGASQEEQFRRCLQGVADTQKRYLNALESRLIFWVALIAFVVGASTGLLGLGNGLIVGVILVAFVAVGRTYFWTWLVRKRTSRVDEFRKRFCHLLDSINDVRWQTRPRKVVAEDKAFLEEHTNAILFPSTLSRLEIESIPSDRDLEHVSILYTEYCGLGHGHLGANTELNCALCTKAHDLRKHVEGALSNYEKAVASARQVLAADFDSANADGMLDAETFVNEYRKRKAMYHVPEDLANGDEKVIAWLESLCDRQRWTFDEADKVRELCRARAKEEEDSIEPSTVSKRLFDTLTQEMKTSATRLGLTDMWGWYDSATNNLAEYGAVIGLIRRVVGRHSPVAMFRELEEQFRRPFLDILNRLPGITKWGYDPIFVAKERKNAAKLIWKERDAYDRECDRELHAVQSLLAAKRRGAE